MKTQYIDNFRPIAREHVASVLALTARTRESCWTLMADVRGLEANLDALLRPFAEHAKAAQDEGNVGDDVSAVLNEFSEAMAALRVRLRQLTPPVIARIERRIAETRVLEIGIRQATDDLIGLPTDPEISPEQREQIERIAAQFAPASAGDHGFTAADADNAARARVAASASRTAA